MISFTYFNSKNKPDINIQIKQLYFTGLIYLIPKFGIEGLSFDDVVHVFMLSHVA